MRWRPLVIYIPILLFFLTARPGVMSTVYVSPFGKDTNAGTRQHPVRTIQRGVDLAARGGRVTILPGTYRETVMVSPQRSAGRLIITGQQTQNEKVVISGGEPASRLVWHQCDLRSCPGVPTNALPHVYRTTLTWDEIPTIITQKTNDGTVHRLTLARSPNEYVEHADKYHEFWWQASGGAPDPSTLVDPMHLRYITEVSGGRLIALDGADRCGTYQYTLTISAHDRSKGIITANAPIGALTYGNQEHGVSNRTRYYVEGAAGLLDTQGEWYVAPEERSLYLWPLEKGNPASLDIDIGRRATGISIGRSNVVAKGISITTINDHDYSERATGALVIPPENGISHVLLSDIESRYVGNGAHLASGDLGIIRNVYIRKSRFADTSKSAIWIAGSEKQARSIRGVSIEKAHIARAGFGYNESAIFMARASDVRITGNRITDSASNGIHITGFETRPFESDNIRVSQNTIMRACQNSSGCAALKFFGGRFKNALVDNNMLADSIGWSSCLEQTEGTRGNGIGLFISNASGIRASNNTSAGNGGGGIVSFTRQFPATDNEFVNNTIARSPVGIALERSIGDPDTNPHADSTRHDRTRIAANLFVGNETAVRLDPAHPETLSLSANTYKDNPTILSIGDNSYRAVSDLRTAYPFWENGQGLKIAAIDKLLPVLFVHPRR